MRYKFNNLIQSLPSCSQMTEAQLHSLWEHTLIINAKMAAVTQEQIVKVKKLQKQKLEVINLEMH